MTELSPNLFSEAWLLAEDFDGTVALTFESSPEQIDVKVAYNMAIEDMFGPKALHAYLENGGLQNRQPTELIQELEPEAEGTELNELAATLTEKKLDILYAQVGTTFPDGSIWPRPSNGYLEFKEKLEAAKTDGALIHEAILSSGHEPFIEKVYQVWGVSQPDFIFAEKVTNDLLALGRSVEEATKPSPILMTIARTAWRSRYNLGSVPEGQELSEELSRIIYVGDDPKKDGELADNSGVRFALLSPESSELTWQSVARRLKLGEQALRGEGLAVNG